MLKVVVIGGVAGGMSAAAKLKRNMGDGVDVVVYEKGRVVSYGACGIPYFVGGAFDDPNMLIERTPEQFEEQGVKVRLRHEVTAVDTGAKRVSGRNLDTNEEFTANYDKLIVASGAAVRKIPPLDVDRDNLYVVRTIEDGVRIKERLLKPEVRDVVVVGAGFIGVEMVEACAKRGKKVVAVEFAERILSVLDPEFTDRLAAEMEKNGVLLRTGSKVTDLVCDGGSITSVVAENAAGRDTIRADMVINCAGIVPNTGFIDVRKAVNGAIIVNERMETSAPDVYAAGDCTIMTSFVTHEHQYAPLGTNANKQGRIIADALSGRTPRKLKLIGSSAVRVFGLDTAKVGISEIEAQRLNLDYKMNRITGNSYATYYAPGKVMIKLVYDAVSRRLLGAQTLGHGIVVPRANLFAVAIAAGMTVDDFGFVDLCYSPPFSGVWDAALIAANTAK